MTKLSRQYQIPDTRYQIPDTRYQIPDTRYQIPESVELHDKVIGHYLNIKHYQ
ncbi:IS1 family transposase [Klebsiella pneumoniae]|uniref:IS1 family transposase n=1 Tax=Klebsiella pneumoniae TaxID=573 RepID=UPI00200BBA19|nr:IS1 family transposase [Klebsiella pneumoniae]UPY99283.1 IS1 family transposase [Klebsiella pneumoniae]